MRINGILIENFCIQEFVPPEIYHSKLGPEGSFRAIQPELISLHQFLRFQYGPIHINNWHKKGPWKECGLRIPGHTYYNSLSDHTRGMAADPLFSQTSEKIVAEHIINMEHVYRSLGLTAIEIGKWDAAGNGRLHLSVANYNSIDLIIIHPERGFITKEEYNTLYNK